MIFASQFMTLDGIASEPEQWHAEFASPASNDLLTDELRSADAQLLGRRTFEELDSFWPDVPAEVPISTATNEVPKIVVTTSLREARWGAGASQATHAFGSTALVGSLEDVPTDRRLMVSGSMTLMDGLLQRGLLDEVHIYLDPVVRGAGRPLFGTAGARLRRTRIETLPHGMTYIEYAVER